jgi:DHA2 family multidrug resistance protein
MSERAPDSPSWAVITAVMLTTLLEVLDLTVVNVSLPHMMGSFGATPDQITWIVTSYMISTIVVMPLTGFLSARFGRREVLLWSIFGFVIASALCGAAWSLESMVVFRLLQGGFGAVLIPLSQTVLFDAFPRAQRAKAMAIWSIAIMVAPIVGPTIGGIITEHFVWRWVFYVNVPIGLFALLLAVSEIPATPRRPTAGIDWLGLLLMSLMLGSLQAVLDLGHHHEWFASKLIMGLAITAAVTAILFVVRGLRVANHIVDLRLFGNRNFTLGCLLVAGYCLTMYATITLLPLLTQRLLGYPPDTAGLLFLPRGTTSALLLIIVGSYLAHRVDARWLIAIGLCFMTVACAFMAGYTLQIDPWGLIWPGMIQGVGMALIFGQLPLVTFETIPRDRADEAAGLYSVMRTLGSAFGVALSGTLYVRQEQVHWHTLGGHLAETNPDFQDWLLRGGVSLQDAAAPAKLAGLISKQASMQAFSDIYAAIAVSFLFLLPLVAMLRKPPRP